MTEPIDREASRWLARLDREDVTAEDRAAFDVWRNADLKHAAAYQRLEAVWQRLGRVQALRADSREAADPNALDALLFVPTTPRISAPPRWLAAAGVAAVACGAIVAVTLVVTKVEWPADLAATVTQQYLTPVGGHERVAFNDGSIAELNTDTELRVTLSATERRIELLRGEATFEVARDARRPFIVVVGDLIVRDLGTVFNVRRREDRIDVLVIEGQVALESARGPSRVQAGEKAVADRAGIEVRAIDAKSLKRALAWKQGMLAFEDVTLLEAAREFNRYNVRRLVIADPAIADLRIGGYFRATNVEGFVRVLEANFAILATRSPTEIRLSRATRR